LGSGFDNEDELKLLMMQILTFDKKHEAYATEL